MDRNNVSMSGGSQDLIHFSEANSRDAFLGIGSSGYTAELNGDMQNSPGKNGAKNDNSTQRDSECDMKEHAVQQNGAQHSDMQHIVAPSHGDQEHGVQHHDSMADGVDDSASEPAIPAIDSAVRERLRISLERNMPDLAEVCFNTMSDEYQSPKSPDMNRTGGNSLDTAADDAYVIPNRPRVFVPFHVMEAVYGKPVPMQSYDHHSAMLPLSHGMPPFMPPPMPIRAYAPTTPSQHHRRRPARLTGSPMQRTSQHSNGTSGVQARSLEESPRRKFSAMLGRCITAMTAIGTADLLVAHKKFTEELERRGVSIGPNGDRDTGRAADQGQTSSKSAPEHGRPKLNGNTNKKASAKMGDPFTD